MSGKYITDIKDQSDNHFFTFDAFSQIDSINFYWREKQFENKTVKIYGGMYSPYNDRPCFLIKIGEKKLIILVNTTTITTRPLLNSSEESCDMCLYTGDTGIDWKNEECAILETIKFTVIHILLSSCLLIITYSNEDDFEIFIQEFINDRRYDILNRRYDDILNWRHKYNSSEYLDEYMKPSEICSSIKFTKIDHEYYDNDYYIKLFIIYQIIRRGDDLVLVVRTYEIKFTHRCSIKTISIKQISFPLPKFPDMVFYNIENILGTDHNLIIIYKDDSDNEVGMRLRIINDYINEINRDEIYDDGCYYIFSNEYHKLHIYSYDNTKSIPLHQKLIGIIDFDGCLLEHQFVERYIK